MLFQNTLRHEKAPLLRKERGWGEVFTDETEYIDVELIDAFALVVGAGCPGRIDLHLLVAE